MPEDGDNVSVVIRCKDEDRWIGHAIQSVLDHLKDPEIIVVDNKSTDDSVDTVKMFEHHVDINQLTIDNYSPGRSLNIGAKNSKYEYVMILSAHCVVTKMNLEKHKKDLESHCVVFGKQMPRYRGRRIGRRYLWSNFVDEPKVNMFCEAENRYFVHNALAFYKKDILVKYPFDEKLYGKEDRYWANDMAGNNIMPTLYDPSLECDHHWTPEGATWKGIG